MGTKRILALLLILAMLVSFSACDTPSPIAGTWVGELDYSKILQEEFADAEHWQDTEFDGISLEIQFEFREDGSFTTQILPDSADAMVQSLLDLAVDGMVKMLQAQNSSLEAIGMTEAELLQRLRSQVDISTLTEPLEFAFGSGYYLCRDNRIYIGSQPGSLRANPEATAAEILEISLNGNTMAVTGFASQDADAEDFLPGLFPFTLEKQ